jgi:hypothetical protein
VSRRAEPLLDLRPWTAGEPVVILTPNVPDHEIYGEVASADDMIVLVDVGSDDLIGFWAYDGRDSFEESEWVLRRPQR